MGDSSKNIDVDKLITYSNDLVAVLKDKKDINNLTQCLEPSRSLKSSCENEFNNVKNLLEDYEKKIEECKKKSEKARLEAPTEGELDILRKELEEEREKERFLTEELRVINNEINELESQRTFVQEQRKNMKKLEQEEIRAQRKLSMYASVTNIIPDLGNPSKISGHIVDREKKMVEKFKFDPANTTAFDTCQSIWKMINLR